MKDQNWVVLEGPGGTIWKEDWADEYYIERWNNNASAHRYRICGMRLTKQEAMKLVSNLYREKNYY